MEVSMSSSLENEENLGDNPAGKPGDSEVACDLFTVDQPTGRPSILRQSQFENVTNKTVPKGVKVCFQTPRRDPATRRILSPSKSSKMNGLEECISNLESLRLASPDDSVCEKNSGNKPVLQSSDTGGQGDVPIQTKGSYQLDLDNLDAMNPFQSSNKMGFSPAKPCTGATVYRSTEMGGLGDTKEITSLTASDSEKVVEEALKSNLVPMVESLVNSVHHNLAAEPPTESPVIDHQKLLVAQSQHMSDDAEELPKALSPAGPEPAQSPETTSEPPPVSNPEEDAPLPARGTYSFDFDNLDSLNPFQTGGSKIPNSPAQDRKMEPVKCSPPKQEHPHNEEKAVEDNPVTAQPVTNAPVVTEEKPAVVKETSSSEPAPADDGDKDKLLEFNVVDDTKVAHNPPVNSSEEDAPLPARGTYSFDLDNLDTVNPFQTGGSKIPNSPAQDRKMEPVKCSPPKQEHPHDEQKVVEDNPVTAQPVTNPAAVAEEKPAVFEETSAFKGVSSSEPAPASDDGQGKTLEFQLADDTKATCNPPVDSCEEDAPLPARGTYSFDLDNLDSVNPFQTGGSKIPNSPAQDRKVESVKCSPPKQEHPHDEQKVVEDNPVAHAPVVTEEKPAVVKDTSGSEPAPADDDDQVKLLEFNFGDEKVKRKPPFKKLGKKPEGTKPSEKPAATEEKAVASAAEPKPAPKTDPQDEEAAIPKGSFSVDFDKWDDPSFNPFGSKAGGQKPVAKINAVQKETDKHTSTMNAEVKVETQNTITARQASDPPAPDTCPSSSAPKPHGAPVPPEPTDMDQLQQNPDMTAIGQEEFVSGNAFMAGLDGQIDYLEQFGSSTFKESALRKQSLYLKFDPLLRESPKKGAGGNTVPVTLPRPSLATRLDAQKPVETKLSQGDSVKLLDVLPAPDPAMLDLLVPIFKQPVKADDAIIEVLKYSQKDMDAALARFWEEADLKREKMKAERDALLEEKQLLGTAFAENKGFFEQLLAEKEKEKQAVLAELKKVQQEKDQALMDLLSMERSHSDLFKRLGKHKEVIDSNKKDEETLKALVEEYVTRIKKEGQRYNSLKAYAEEKISLANKQYAEVTSKNRAEVTSLQAQLKREQIRNQSLQMSLDQKMKDVEELNKVCEELILNVHQK